LLGLRFFSPLLGRFVTRDPQGFGAGDWSQYRYVLNQPTVHVDPIGLDDVLGIISELPPGIRRLKQCIDGAVFESIEPPPPFRDDPRRCMRIYPASSARRKKWYCKCKVRGANIPKDCASFYYGSGDTENDAKRDATNAAAAEDCHNPPKGYNCGHHECRQKPFGV
jgi:uncharacterized protein RhaS with RHS repeats